MEEELKCTIDRLRAMQQEFAGLQAEAAIGQAVLALHQEGRAVNVPTLIAHLLDLAHAHETGNLPSLKHMAGARLLGWTPDRK